MSFQPAVKQPRRFRNRRLETTTMWPPEELSGRLPGQANELATSSKNRDALFQGSMPPELQNPFALVRAGPKLQTPQELWGPETSGVAGAMAWAVESLQRDSTKTPKRENRQGIHGSVGVGPLQAVRCPELPVFQRPAPAPASQEAAARAESAERGRKRGLKTSTPITCPGIPYVTTLWRHWRRGGGPRFHIGGSRHAPSIHIPHRRCHARPWSLKVPPLCLPQAGGSLRKQTTTTTSFCRLFHPRALPPRHHRLQTPQTQSCSALRLLRLGSAGLRRGVHRTKGASLGGLERLCAVVAASFPPSSLVRGSL